MSQDSSYNRFDHKFRQPGISQDMYKFTEEEEASEDIENDNYIEEVDCDFRHKAIQIYDDNFRHKTDIQDISSKNNFTYFKSDFFFASKIYGKNATIDFENKETVQITLEEHKIDKIDFENKEIINLTYQFYIRLFGFECLSPIINKDDAKKKDKIEYNEEFTSFLDSISLNRNARLDTTEAKNEWKKIHLKHPNNEEINYNDNVEINVKNKYIGIFKDCKLGSDNESVIKWILAFHNIGIMNNIRFTFVIFYKNDEKSFSKFSVGKRNYRNRCFATFLFDDKKIILIPSVLRLFTITKKNKMKKEDAHLFSPISNLFWLLSIKKEENENNENNECKNYKTLFYNIYTQGSEKDVNYKKKEKNESENMHSVDITSTFKLNSFLKKPLEFQTKISGMLKKYYEQIKINTNEDLLNFSITTSGRSIAYIQNVNSNDHYNGKVQEYKIFVGIRGISYNFPNVSSHISITSYMNLMSFYVDENLDKMYCFFNDDVSPRLVEGDFGTAKVTDMKTVLLFDFSKKPKQDKNVEYKYIITEAKFQVDKKNHLHLNLQIIKDGATDFSITCNKNKDGSWEVTNEKIDEDLITEIKDGKIKKIKKFNRYTLPIALEINNKLFVLSNNNTLYHPSWRNCILRQAIISTFYRFAYHMASDSLVFEISDADDQKIEDKNKVVSAVIYPHIDIGFRGNIRRIFTSTISPGIYEYSDRAFNYEPLKDLLPYTKSDNLFFNNGQLKVGLDRHRTKCQIAATALFSYACSIYGPGMMIRDFKIGKGNPYSRECFQQIHNFLVASYGTFLKMENDFELEYAIDVISEELNIEDNKDVYKNLMNELRKNYY